MIVVNDNKQTEKTNLPFQENAKVQDAMKGTKQRDFFVCKFCNKKVTKTYLGQHLLLAHGDRVYTHYVIAEQSQIEESDSA
jgi:UDP-2,3-diacylglucosamine pyrophosphatase LpxH